MSVRASASGCAPVAPDVASRQQDVVERRHPRNQQERLEDVADASPAHAGLRAARQMAHAKIVEPDLAGVGRLEQPRRFRSVDLPEPEAPTMATNSPGFASRSTPASTGIGAPLGGPERFRETDGAHQHRFLTLA